jgi:lysozyme
MMEHSDNCTNLVKDSEGLYLKAYLCPADVLTIGYGHTGHDVVPGMKITEEEAIDFLNEDLYFVDRFVDSLGIAFNQNQHDALVSFAFNLGNGALQHSTLLKKAKIDPNDITIADEFAKWVYGGGKKLPGLVKRRARESKLYFS